MSFEHKAFAFDWQAFADEMLPWISDALSTEDRERFVRLVDANLTLYRCPYDGRALSSSWKDFLDVGDAQELADFALTKYYDPTDDHGLGEAWIEEEVMLPENMRHALLGYPIVHFDPGRQGSYVFAVDHALNSAELLRKAKSALVREYAGFLEEVARRGFGVYVTF